MTEALNLVVLLAEQYINQVPNAITLAGAIDRRQRLSCRFGGVPSLYAIDAVVAVPTGVGHDFVEVGKQRLTAAAGFFAQRQHRVELVLLDALVPLVALGV